GERRAHEEGGGHPRPAGIHRAPQAKADRRPDGQARMGRVVRLQEGALAQMTLFVDTSVWSMALRRDAGSGKAAPEASALRTALEGGQEIVTTGLILQELLQGFSGPRARGAIVEQFSAIPLLAPDRQDHIDAAELRNRCRRAGVQVATIDALLAQLA